MANTSTMTASKFFAEAIKPKQHEVVVFCEEDFETLSEFKSAIADQIRTVSEQDIALMWQHKGFKVGNNWSFNIKELNKYCLSHNAQLVEFGTMANDYTWKVIPLRGASLTSTPHPF